MQYTRNFIGYGSHPPDAKWPFGARVAVQFVLNYEEGGERCVLDGDLHAETFLSEIIQAPPYPMRHMSMESLYEYGSRVGVWRVLREFERRGLLITVFGVAMALARNPEVTAAFMDLGHEIAGHGLRWLDYQDIDINTERSHLHEAIQLIKVVTGQRPLGWYTGRDSPNTRFLVIEEGGFEYSSDYYGDELPFWVDGTTKNGQANPHLIIPYSLDTNDMRFSTVQGFNTAEHFFSYLRDSFDTLYAEGIETPRMMSIGLHSRLIGKPGRFVALQRFLDYLEIHEHVWVARRLDIARHWREFNPYKKLNNN